MRLQRQAVFGGPDDLEPGNCWSTCLAMFLGIDTADVPNFCGLHRGDDGEWYRKAAEWLAPRGVMLMTFKADPATWAEVYKGAVCIASGPAERGHDHAVLWREGRVLYDPHPSDAGLIEAREWDVFVVTDPDAFARFVSSREAVTAQASDALPGGRPGQSSRTETP